jgi:hypothetical protein
MDEDSIAALTCVDHVCPDCQTTSDTWLICPIWQLKVYRGCGSPGCRCYFPLSLCRSEADGKRVEAIDRLDPFRVGLG